MWSLLHGWKIPLWRYPILTTDCRLSVPAVGKAQAVQASCPKSFKADMPYTAEPVIIIRFCNAVTGTPTDNAHAYRATQSWICAAHSWRRHYSATIDCF